MLRIRGQLGRRSVRGPCVLRAVQYVILGAVTAVLGAPILAIAQDNPVTGAMPAPSFGGRLNGSYFRPRAGVTGEFTVDKAAPRAGDVVNFHASDASDVALHYYWSFGDGTFAAGRDAAHTYSGLGTFAPTLVVTDYSLRSRTAAHELVVWPAITGDFAIYSTPTRVGDPVQFEPMDPNLAGFNFSWEFSDGTSSQEQSPRRSFDSAGTKRATLWISDANGGLRSTVTKDLVVSAIQEFSPTRIGFVRGLGDVNSICAIPNTTRMAVASRDMGLVIVDMAAAGGPQIVNSEPAPAVARFVSVYGNFAFVASDTISVPTRIVDLNSMQTVATSQYYGSRFAQRNGIAYFASSSALTIVDYRNPTAPSLVASLPMQAKDVALSPIANVAYVACTDSLKVIDLATNPPQVSLSIPATSGYLTGVSLNSAGTLLGVSWMGGSNAALFYDVSSPSSPVFRSFAPAASGMTAGQRICVNGSSVAIVGSSSSWWVDLSNPASPRNGTIVSPVPKDVVPAGGDFYFAMSTGIQKYTGSYSSFSLATQLLSTEQSRASAAANSTGTLCLVAGGAQSGETLVVDTSVRNSPRLASRISAAGAVAIVGTRGIIAGTTGFRLVDLSNSAAPTVLSTLSAPAGLDLCVTNDGWAYTASGVSGIGVVDISSWNTASFVRYIAAPGASAPALNIAMNAEQTTLFVANDTGGVYIYDISGSRRSMPTQIAQIGTADYGRASYIAIDGDKLLVTGTQLAVYSVANPSAPVRVQRITSSIPQGKIRTGEGRAFVPRGYSGTDVWEWSSTTNQYRTVTTISSMSGRTDTLAIANGHAFCAELATPVVCYDLFP